MENGAKWVTPHGFFSMLRDLKYLDSYNKFEEWMVQSKPKLNELHMFHETWLGTKKPQWVRVSQWLTVFFKYTNFKNLRPMVSLCIKLRLKFLPKMIFDK